MVHDDIPALMGCPTVYQHMVYTSILIVTFFRKTMRHLVDARAASGLPSDDLIGDLR